MEPSRNPSGSKEKNMLRILLSQNPRRNLDFCLSELAQFTKEGFSRRAFFLVPEEIKLDTERRYLEHFDRRGLMMAEVLSFRRLAHRLFSEVGGLASPSLSDNGKALMLTRLLQEQREDFPFLGRFAGKAAYAAELSQIIGDFMRSDLSVDMLRQVAEKAAGEETREKLRDLALLRERYEARKAQLGLRDADEDFPRLVRLLREEAGHPRLAFLRDAAIWVAGFSLLRAFTPQEVQVLQALNELCPSLTVALTPDLSESRLQLPQAATGQKEASWLLRLEAEGTKAGDAGLRQLLRAFPQAQQVFIDEAPSALCLPSVELWRSANSREEFAACAGTIKRLLKEGKLRRREIGVALCKEEDMDLLSACFREFSLDPFIAAARPLDESPLLRYLRAFFRLAAGEARTGEVLALLHSGLCGGSSLETDLLDNFMLASGLRFASEFEGEHLYRRVDEAKGEAAKTLVGRILKPQMEAARQLSRLASGPEKSLFLQSWLDEASGIREKLETLALQLNREGESDRALLISLSWEACLKALEEASEILGEQDLSVADFAELILSALRGQRPGGIPLGIDRVRVGGLRQMLLYPCRWLFILGAKAGTFPPGLPAEGLLQNREREEIEALSEQISPEKAVHLPNYRRDAVSAGDALLHFLSHLPSEKLLLSSPSLDREELSDLQLRLGEVKASSEARKSGGASLPQEQSALPLVLPVVEKIFAERSSPDCRWLSPERAAISLGGRRKGVWQLWQEALEPYLKKAPAEAADPLDLLRPDIRLSEENRAELAKQAHSLSVSRLESYNACPYQHFGSYLLRLEEPEIWRPDVQHRGRFLHAFMEKSLRRLSEIPVTELSSETEIRQFLEKMRREELHPHALRQLYDELAGEKGFRAYDDPAVRGGEGRRLLGLLSDNLAAAWDDLEQSLFLPRLLEWSFPQPDMPESRYYIGNGAGRRLIRGIIDRVDEKANALRILDYKSSLQSSGAVPILRGEELQLPLYAAVLSQCRPSKEIQSYAIHSLLGERPQSGDKKEKIKRFNAQEDPDFVRLSADYSKMLAEKILAQMQRGDISPHPLSTAADPLPSACSFCAYSDLCRLDQRLAEARCRRVEALEPLTQLASRGKARAAAEKLFLEGLLKLGRSAEELSRTEAEELLAELTPLKEKHA